MYPIINADAGSRCETGDVKQNREVHHTMRGLR